MTEKKTEPIDGAGPRCLAEERLGEIIGTTSPLGREEEQLILHHELQVQRDELGIQNAELRQAREELEMALEKYTDLYDLAPVGYFTLDRRGAINSVNLTGAALLGVERSSLVGSYFGLFVVGETQPVFSDFLGKVFTSPDKESCELVLLKDGNAPLYVQVEGRAGVQGQECRMALIDISGRKRVEEALQLEKEEAVALRQAKEVAEATARAKSQFLANMSHELRTPMTSILGLLQIVLMEELSPEQREYVDKALDSGRSLLRILNDILELAKLSAGKLAIVEKPFSLRGCIAEAVDICIPKAHQKELDIVVSVAEDVPDTVAGDHTRLRQVLVNLIGNAVKFTERGNVEAGVTVKDMRPDGKREFTFAVTDTGIGIPDDKKGILFQAFSQVDTSLSRKYGGTGLGLAISKELVELMGGTIAFVSEEGTGSTFSVTIPLGEAVLRDTPSGAGSFLS